MNKKYSSLSKNTLLFTLNNFGSKIISFLLVPLYTTVLSSKDYGTADLLVSAVALMLPILTLNIQDAVLRFSLDKNENKEEVIRLGLRQMLIGSVVLSLFLIIVSWLDIFKLDGKYILFLLALFALNGFYNIFSMYLKAVDKINVFVIASLINTLVTCGLNVVLLLFLKMGINGYLVANIAGFLIANLIMFVFGDVIHCFKFKPRNGLFKEMLLYSSPLIFNSVAWWINDASDKYVLTLFCGVAVNGVFAIAYKIPTILSTVQTVFYNAWSISAIKYFDKDDSDGFLGKIYSFYSCISVLGCSVILLLNIPLAKILYANEFFGAWQYVPFLLLGAVFNGLALFEGCLFTAIKKTKAVSYTTIVGAIANFCTNIVLIKLIGPIGVSIATMIGYLTTWIVRTFLMLKFVNLRVNWTREIVALILITAQTFLAINPGFELIQIFLILILLTIYSKYLFVLVKSLLKKQDNNKL